MRPRLKLTMEQLERAVSSAPMSIWALMADLKAQVSLCLKALTTLATPSNSSTDMSGKVGTLRFVKIVSLHLAAWVTVGEVDMEVCEVALEAVSAVVDSEAEEDLAMVEEAALVAVALQADSNLLPLLPLLTRLPIMLPLVLSAVKSSMFATLVYACTQLYCCGAITHISCPQS